MKGKLKVSPAVQNLASKKWNLQLSNLCFWGGILNILGLLFGRMQCDCQDSMANIKNSQPTAVKLDDGCHKKSAVSARQLGTGHRSDHT